MSDNFEEDLAELRNRWHTNNGTSILTSIVDQLRRSEKISWTSLALSIPRMNEVEDCRDLRGITLCDKQLDHTNFNGISMCYSTIRNCIICKSAFYGADLTYCNIEYSEIQDCDFSGVFAPRMQIKKTSINSTAFNNAVLTGGKFLECNLVQIDFSGATLVGVHFEDSNQIRCIYTKAIQGNLAQDQGDERKRLE